MDGRLDFHGQRRNVRSLDDEKKNRHERESRRRDPCRDKFRPLAGAFGGNLCRLECHLFHMKLISHLHATVSKHSTVVTRTLKQLSGSLAHSALSALEIKRKYVKPARWSSGHRMRCAPEPYFEAKHFKSIFFRLPLINSEAFYDCRLSKRNIPTQKPSLQMVNIFISGRRSSRLSNKRKKKHKVEREEKWFKHF